VTLYYQYWEEFIKQWRRGKWTDIKDWSDPDELPLFNKTERKEFSSLFIPEPWWGNDGTQPLHSVVINFNPGEGGPEQKRSAFPDECSYAHDVVADMNRLSNTRKWHKSKRAMRILNTLYRNHWIKGSFGLENHLSVELIPWHTKNVTNNYMPYLIKNILAVYKHSICFAANESLRIQNDKLKSVVIVRTNDIKAQCVLDELKQKGIMSEILDKGMSSSGKGKYMKFSFPSLPDIRFICIWGEKSRNDFPPNKDMDDIIEMI
jgi:hypothetical protein